jgi:hypothetical protein
MSDGPPLVLLLQWGFSSMHWAAQNEHEGVVAQLLRVGAAVDAADKVRPDPHLERRRCICRFGLWMALQAYAHYSCIEQLPRSSVGCIFLHIIYRVSSEETLQMVCVEGLEVTLRNSIAKKIQDGGRGEVPSWRSLQLNVALLLSPPVIHSIAGPCVMGRPAWDHCGWLLASG